MRRHLGLSTRTTLATAVLCAGAVLTAVPVAAAPAASPTLTTDPTQIEQIAADGYVYGVGPVVAARTRADKLCNGAVNSLVNQTNLATPLAQAVVAPNVDTLYSIAWLDLRQGPVVLSVPDMGDRYHVLQLLDIYTNTFADLGTRVDGQQAGQFAVVPPGWTGTLPAGTQRVDAPTWDVWMLGRTLVNGPDDLDAARAAQAGYAVTPAPGGTTGTVPPPLPQADCANPPDPTTPGDGGAEFFDELAAVLAADPPPAADQPILDQLASIGVTPGSTPSQGDPTTVAALAAGVTDGEARVQSASSSVLVPSGTWFSSLDAGTYGVDYLTRAAIATKVLGANIPAESLYYLSGLDANGKVLTGSTAYVLHFPASNGLPPVDDSGFWSVTMYNADMYLVPNAQRRYSIGDRTSGLVYNADGSLDVYLSSRPPVGHTANWLPAPSGAFNLIVRAYVPLESALDNTWHPPAITPVA